MWKTLIAVGGKSKVTAPSEPNTPIPNHMNGNEPQQSVRKKGRAKRIPTNKHTENNIIIIIMFVLPP